MSQLRAIVERIERLHEEKKALEDDIREIYAEAKANGFDTKVLRQVVKARGQDPDARSEAENLFDLYWTEIHGPRVHTRDAREAVSPKLVETIAQAVQTETGRKALGMALDVMIDAETGEITEQPETAKSSAGPSSSLSGNETEESPVATTMESDDVDCRSSGEQAYAPYSEQAARPHHEPSGAKTGSDVRTVATIPVAKAGEDAHHTMLAATTDPASRGEDVEDRQPLASPGIAGEREPASGQPVSAEQEPAPHSQPLRKTAADYRTHCLRPDACGASSLDHCFTCKQVMAEGRVPA